jgi:hypothetical protein
MGVDAVRGKKGKDKEEDRGEQRRQEDHDNTVDVNKWLTLDKIIGHRYLADEPIRFELQV